MAKIMFADDRCKGCGLCAKYCPNQAVVMTGTKPKVPFWTNRCEACLRCMGYCRPRAVEASHLWLGVVMVATLLLTAGSLERALGNPPSWKHLEPLHVVGAFDDLHPQAIARA
jgi:MinD superfamily P-loop ATPase